MDRLPVAADETSENEDELGVNLEESESVTDPRHAEDRRVGDAIPEGGRQRRIACSQGSVHVHD